MTISTEITLKQAIQHAKDQAEKLAGTPCGSQHAQLAGWLSELREARAVKLVENTAMADVIFERQRQVNAKGWTSDHDDEHVNDEIAALAALYAMPEACRDWSAKETGYGSNWAEAICPNGWVAKFGDRRRDLVKAASLIIAEIERIDRAGS